VSVLVFSFVCILACTSKQRLQTYLPLSTKVLGVGNVQSRPRLQHRRQLRHEHELAELPGRDDDDVPDPDGRLAVRNFTSAASGIAVAIALTRGLVRRSSPTIGNFWVTSPAAPSTSCCRSPWSGAFPGIAGRHPDVREPLTLHTSRARARSSRSVPWLRRGDQGAGQQRRRLLQRQLGPSLRDPPPSRTGSRCSHRHDPVRSDEYVRMAGNVRQGVHFSRHDRGPFRRLAGRNVQRGALQPIHSASRPTGRQSPEYGGKETRFARIPRSLATVTTGTSTGAVDSMHDSFLPSRSRAALQHRARRNHSGGVAPTHGILFFAIIAVFMPG